MSQTTESATAGRSSPPTPRVPLGRFALRIGLWLVLGGWIGAWFFFGAVVAPTAFRELPSTEIAGTLIGPVLTALHLYGVAAGLVLAAMAQALGHSLWLRLIPLALSAACLYSHFGVTAQIAEIRGQIFGPGGNVEAAERFRSLHALSMSLFVGVGLVAIVLAMLHAWADTRDEASRGDRASAPGSL